MKSTSEILERIKENSKKHKDEIFTRLYRYLLRDDIYYSSYKKLYANQGAATKGVDNDTADGFGKEYLESIINELKTLKYKPEAVRRTYIKKKNGKLRPLGIPSFRDKLVQDVIRKLLEAIYEPLFSDKSHGFRPNRSCHTALSQLKKEFGGIKWFIEGDIKGCFDNINHEVLLEIISEKIKDSKLLGVIRNFLKAGYLEDWQYHNTYSGTPQGGIISPILANIYLDKLDKKIEEMKIQFDKPAKRYKTKEYKTVEWAIHIEKKKLKENPDAPERIEWINRIKQLKKQQRATPCKDTTDKKLVYIRYADDFIIGVNGTKEECIQIKNEIKEFLSNQLKLELSEEKTKITHSSESVRFLGYDVTIRRNQQVKRRSDGVVQRTLNNSVELLVPLKDKIERFVLDEGIAVINRDGKLQPWHRKDKQQFTDLEILDTYNSQTRGICNYYCIASNFNKLRYFTYIMEYSCLKTLSAKHQASISQIMGKYRAESTWGIPYDTKNGKKLMKIVQLKDCKRKNSHDENIDTIKNTHHGNTVNTLENRLKANKCELCGSEESCKFEIHHVNKLKNLKGKKDWEKIMIAKRRKTLVVCTECHYKIHHLWK